MIRILSKTDAGGRLKMLMGTPEKVGEVLIEKHGCFEVVDQYYRGWHPEIHPAAVLQNGWSGQETRVRTSIIRPIRTFQVPEAKKDQ